jgi:curved DNA-binding protein CbpA
MESEEKRERRTSAGASAPPRIETPYEVLGLRYGASKEEIKRAFQKLVMETHPDRNLPTSDAGRFAAVVRARDALLGG